MNHPASISAHTIGSYHYWRGRSGQSYVHSVYPAHEAPQIAGASVIVARRFGARLDPLIVGATGTEPASFFAARAFSRAADAADVEVHLHVPAEPAEANGVSADIAASMQGLRKPVKRKRMTNRTYRPRWARAA